ncbi:MAG: hypothetical protein Q7R63_02225 [bacterium]|nr:hypothetical protein [bacterium]
MQPTQSQKEAAVRTEREKISARHRDTYEKVLSDTVNWLLNDPQGPLKPFDRGQFLGGIRNGVGSTRMKHEGALAAFAELDWPNAKAAEKLCDKMAGFIGLMEMADEGPYRTFAQTEFDEANEALGKLVPKYERPKTE